MTFTLFSDTGRRCRRDLPRGRGGGHRLHPRRPLRRSAGEDAARAPPSRPCSRWARTTRPCCATASRRASRWPTSSSATGSSCARARRSPPTARVVEGGSAIDASMLTGESVPVEVGPGDGVVGATINVRRAPRRAGHPGRRRHRARRHGPARRAGADRQGRRAAPRRPRLRRLRSRRHRAGARHARRLAAARREPRGRLHGRGRDAHHRVPVRARTRHADRAARRHRARRAARHPHQGAADPRVDPPGRHDRPRQDRHGDDGPDDADRGHRPPPVDDEAELLRLAGAVEVGSEHPIAAAIATSARRAPRRAARDRVVLVGAGPRRAGASSTATSSLVGRATWLAEQWGVDTARAARAGARSSSNAVARTVVAVAWDGEVRGILAVSDTVRPTSAAAIARMRELGLTPILLTGDNVRAARAVAAEVGIDEVRAEVLPAGEGRGRPRPAAAGACRGDGRRRRQRRGRARHRRPRHRDGHRHGCRDRGERPHPRAQRPDRRRSMRSGSRARRSPRSRRTCSGRSRTTSPRSRSRCSAC